MALQYKKISCEILLYLLLMCYVGSKIHTTASSINDNAESENVKKESVKKDLEREKSPIITQQVLEGVNTAAVPLPTETHLETHKETQQPDKLVVISEKTLTELQAEIVKKEETQLIQESQKAENGKNEPTEASTVLKQTISAQTSQVQVEESGFKQNIYNMSDEIPESYKSGFYFFFGISILAIILTVAKIYRMRLSRAERKYGVQGDRTTQELTPLPIAIEDGNSDDEDHTLFEVNRQQIRIL